MITTRLTSDYGLKTPLANAGMAFVAGPELAAAVTNAGGLGVLGAGILSPEDLRGAIQKTRLLTSGLIGVDVLAPMMSAEHYGVLIEEKVPVVVFFWGLPDKQEIAMLRRAGARLWAQVGSLAEAAAAVEVGMEALIVQGSEAGGHNRSEAAVFTLLPAIRGLYPEIPILAAGGIVDDKSFAAVLLLGADGAWCGTRFLASEEADASMEYQAAVVHASPGSTVIATCFGPEWPDQPSRVLKNRAVIESLSGQVRDVPHGTSIGTTRIGSITYDMPKFSATLPTRGATGDPEEMCLTMGESAGRIHSIQPAAEIVAAMTSGASEILSKLTNNSQAV
jgi:NAD(P)H-dependent flavin oxidoreductase YrpB (nitropropane dioxygenase family)